jgi:hypothetical protein
MNNLAVHQMQETLTGIDLFNQNFQLIVIWLRKGYASLEHSHFMGRAIHE